jgi:methylated-DNA-[protein]-cysteine S-methyltransferase
MVKQCQRHHELSPSGIAIPAAAAHHASDNDEMVVIDESPTQESSSSNSNSTVMIYTIITNATTCSTIADTDDIRRKQNKILFETIDDYGNPVTLSPFQRSVYSALCSVPIGYVTTYQSIGRYIGCKSAQAIGQALKRNPYSYPNVIPCHRVIKSDGTIGGFHGHTSGSMIERKISILQSERVRFKQTTSTCNSTKGGFQVHPSCIYCFNRKIIHGARGI